MGPKKKDKKKKGFEDADEEEREAKRRAEEERLEQERIRLEMEKELRKMKRQKKKEAAREKYEEEVRLKVLQPNCAFFEDFIRSRKAKAAYDRQKKEWDEYTSCTVQPFPYDPTSLNTHLYAFHEREETGYIENINSECEKLIEILERIDEYIDNPMYLEDRTIRNLTEVKYKICNEILSKYDDATFQAVMNIEKYFSRIDVWKVEALQRSKSFLLWIWGWAVGGNVERKKKRIFKDTMPKRRIEDFDVRLPRNFKYQRLHLRIIRLSYDIYSWQSPTFHLSKSPDPHGLYQETLNIRERNLKILKDHSSELDPEVMPWWYLQVYPPPPPPPVKNKLEKGRDVKSSKIFTKEAVVAPTDLEEEECEEEETFSEILFLDENQKVFTFDDQYLNLHQEQKTSLRVSRLTAVVSSEARKNNEMCRERIYYEEPDAMDFLECNFRNLSTSSSSTDREEDKVERRTTFKASLYAGAPQIESKNAAQYLKAIKRALNPSETSEKEPLFEVDKKEFLEWESWGESFEYNAEELEDKLYNILYGEKRNKENDNILKHNITNIEKKKKNKNKPLRTLRELIEELELKQEIDVNDDSNLKENRKSKESSKNQPRTDLLNVTTPDEMRAFDDVIFGLIDFAHEVHADFYISELLAAVEKGKINLREHTIIGCVYLTDFIKDEPQAVVDANNIKTQLHYGEYKLKKCPFFAVPVVHFDAALAAERQLSAARGSRRASSRVSIKPRQKSSLKKQAPVELEDDETIHVKLKVYDKALWFSTPIPVLWDDASKSWTTENVYDAEFNHEEGKVFFKLGKTSVPLALASYRWHNLPYMRYLLRPDSAWETKPSILFTISGREVTIEFVISEESITIKSVERKDSKPVKHIIGVPFRMYDLVKAMRKCNLDMFPDWDTFIYVNTALRKCRPLEDHMYKCLAFISSAFDIADSHWNQISDDSRIYMKMRESFGDVPREFDCLVAMVDKVFYVKSEATDMEAPYEPFDPALSYHPDLKSFVESTASEWAKKRIRSAPSGLVENVYSMLYGTKVLSFT